MIMESLPPIPDEAKFVIYSYPDTTRTMQKALCNIGETCAQKIERNWKAIQDFDRGWYAYQVTLKDKLGNILYPNYIIRVKWWVEDIPETTDSIDQWWINNDLNAVETINQWWIEEDIVHNTKDSKQQINVQKQGAFQHIKKQNGETFAQTIRNYDNGIFDIPNIVTIVKYAWRDARPILEYLESLKNIKIDSIEEIKDPFMLLSDAGYNAEYADTLEKQNKIQEYFEPTERLCTFDDNTRYKRYYIINAIKKNIDDIKREDFKNPQREDIYGTSVISIQILKKGGFISIKNRYNHSVLSPDNTFSSNPDNIIEWLGSSLKKYFNVDFSAQEQNLPNGFTVVNGNIVKYLYEINNVYFGKNFYAKDGEITIPPSHHILMDYFIYDNKEQKLIDIADIGISLNDKNKQTILNLARLRISPHAKSLIINMNSDLHELMSKQIEIFKIKYWESILIMKCILNKENESALRSALKQLFDNELYNFVSSLPARFPRNRYAKDLVQCLTLDSRSASDMVMNYLLKE